MKLHSLKTRGVGMPFRASEVTIDFDALPDGLVALVGDNGSGKSHLLELSGPATLHRELASYGESFSDHVAPGVRDAFSELVFSLGSDCFRALVQSDPAFGGGRGKTEAYLFRADERNGDEWTPVAGPLVREYDAAVAKILASKELFLASVFACQGGKGSFFGLAKAERKDLFGSMLGLAHLQEKSEIARNRAQAVLQKLERTREQIGDAEVDQQRAAVLVDAIVAKTETLDALDTQVVSARAALESARAELAAAKEALARAESEAVATSRDRARIESEKDQAQQKIGALMVRLEQIDDSLIAAGDVRAAAEKLVLVDEEIRTAQAKEREASERLRPIEAQIATLDAQRATLLADHRRLSAELEAAKAAGVRVDAASTLERDMEERRAQVSVAAAQIAECSSIFPGLETAAEQEAAQIEQRSSLEARRKDLSPRRELLSKIPGVPECEACPLTVDARAARDSLFEVERQIAEMEPLTGAPAKDALGALGKRERALQAKLAIAQQWIAENAPKLERLAADTKEAIKIVDLSASLARIAGEGTAVRAQLEEARESAEGLEAGRSRAERRVAELSESRRALAESAGRLEAIAGAEAQKGEVAKALAAAKAEAMAAAAALSELPVHDVAGPMDAVATATIECGRASDRLTTADASAGLVRSELAKLTGEREALGDPADELEKLRAKEGDLVTDAADWSLLERALGRDGVQALAIDAAGPTVSALANDLLASCYGPRFSLALETTAQTKDGKKQREVFDIRILDAEAGREAKQGSGGEMVLLDESLRLALAIFNTQRSGIPLRTLWRDETTGALSPENADRYIAMLRRAMELGGFERCLFVAHQENVWAQADARIFIANGAVSLDDERAAA